MGAKDDGAKGDDAKRPSFDTIAKMLGVSGIVLYVFGLVAVNSYLAPFGVTEFALFKPQFVYTGALLLAPIALSALVLAACVVVANHRLPCHPRRAGAWALVSSFFISCLLATPFIIREDDKPHFSALRDSWKIPSTSVLIVFVVYIASLPQTRERFWTRVGGTGDERSSSQWSVQAGGRVAAALVLTLVVAGCFNFYLGRFNDDVFPAIARQAGGGKPFLAVVALTPAGVAQARELEVPIDPRHATLTRVVTIVFEGSDFYLLCLPTPPSPDKRPVTLASSEIARRCIRQTRLLAVRLDKSLVSGIQTSGSGR